MVVTDVKITRYPDTDNQSIKASVSIVLDDAIAIHGIKIFENKKKDGYFIKFPAKKKKDENGKDIFKDICHPINSDARNIIQDAIFDMFETLEQDGETKGE